MEYTLHTIGTGLAADNSYGMKSGIIALTGDMSIQVYIMRQPPRYRQFTRAPPR